MNSNRLKRAAVVLGAVLAAALVLGAVGLTTAAAQEPDGAAAEIVARRPQPGDMMTTVLQPGDNLVGWIEGAASVPDLFDAVAEIEMVWAWDVLRRQWSAASRRVPSKLHTLRTLKPGMGLLVQVGGDEAVEWRRSAYPAAGLVKLHKGPNLVAWSGREESSIAYLALGIGASFDGAEIWDAANTQYLSYDPSNGENGDSLLDIRRGDAVWITVSRTVNWLQPTGVLPSFNFPPGTSQEVREGLTLATEQVLDFFARRYGIEADHSLLGIELADLRNHSAAGLGGATSISVDRGLDCLSAGPGSAPAAQPSPRCLPLLIHEYFHTLQRQLSDNHFGLLTEDPTWLTEGTAEFMVWRHASPTDGNVDNPWSAQRLAAFGEPPSDPLAVEGILHSYPYRFGQFAADLLARRAGDLSVVEYYRQLAPIAIGPHFRWQSRSSWDEVFEDVFELTVDQFHVEVHDRWRQISGDATPTTDESEERFIQGRLVEVRGAAISDALVTYIAGGGRRLYARTDQQGQFQLRVPRQAGALLGGFLRIEVAETCELFYGRDGFAAWEHEASPIALSAEGPDLQIRMPSDLCPWVRGRVVDENGIGLSGVLVGLGPVAFLPPARTGDDGRFAFRASALRSYEFLTIELAERCEVLAARHGGVTTDLRDVFALDLQDGPADGIRIEVPGSSCRWQISGRAVDARGIGFHNATVYAFVATVYALVQGLSVDIRTIPNRDGSFTLTVPTNENYSLQLTLGKAHSDGRDCVLNLANDGGLVMESVEFQPEKTLRMLRMISVMNADVTGLLIEIPDDACS